MKKALLLLPFILMLFAAKPYFNIKNQQLGYARVKVAYQEKEESLKSALRAAGVSGNFDLYFRAFKNEAILEAWVKPSGATQYMLFKTYPICEVSGELGPKRQGGDYQTPEGFYFIDRFNPQSQYHLSLGIDYPNQADRINSKAADLGGDIFIHGSCITAGCLPMTDDLIKEIYVLSIEAGNNTQIPIHIFPFKITEKLYSDAVLERPELTQEQKETILFWRNLGEGMKYFDQTRTLPAVSVNASGQYVFNM
jgi:murein L,D-transpeptidase YafK